MDRTQATEMLQLLTTTFETKEVKFYWIQNADCSWANYKEGWIKIGALDRHGLDAMLHEYAHILDRHRTGGQYIHDGRGTVHHGPSFYQALKDVAAAWYSDLQKYGWNREYRRIQQWARSEGLLVA